MHVHSTRNATKALAVALSITAIFFVIELVGGILANSLALQSDAFHMLTDVSALSYALVAAWLARRPVTLKRTYGYYRIEILSAFLNGILLWAVVIFIVYQAIQRLQQPSIVQSLNMLVISVLGLIANIAVSVTLSSARNASLNIRGAFLHVLADILGSVGAISAGLIMYFTGWYQADPIASILISALVLYSSGTLVRDSVNVLLESVPPHVDVAALQKRIIAIPAITNVHDLHVWSISDTKMCCMSAHVVAEEGSDSKELLTRLIRMLKEEFGIDHTTIQLEGEDYPKAAGEHY
jgi:cobalt-zinc-cadmium efflux system protein